MTVRQKIVTKIRTLLLGIKISDGYSFNIGNNVFDYYAVSLDDDTEIPCCNIEDEEDERNGQETILRIYIDVIVKKQSGKTASEVLREAMQDVLTAMSNFQPGDDYVKIADNEYLGSTKVKDHQIKEYILFLYIVSFDLYVYHNIHNHLVHTKVL